MVRPLKNVQFWSRSRKTKISTTGIYRIFRGLKFESDAEIDQISADFERGRFAEVSFHHFNYLLICRFRAQQSTADLMTPCQVLSPQGICEIGFSLVSVVKTKPYSVIQIYYSVLCLPLRKPRPYIFGTALSCSHPSRLLHIL